MSRIWQEGHVLNPCHWGNQAITQQQSSNHCEPQPYKAQWTQLCTSWHSRNVTGRSLMINSLRPKLNRRPPADDILKCIFLNENEWISPRISLNFVPKVRINNIPALVQIMAWRRPGDKPLSEPMMVNLLTHICVTRPQWVNMPKLSDELVGENVMCLIVWRCYLKEHLL